MHTDIIHNPEIAMLFMDRHVPFPEIIYTVYTYPMDPSTSLRSILGYAQTVAMDP